MGGSGIYLWCCIAVKLCKTIICLQVTLRTAFYFLCSSLLFLQYINQLWILKSFKIMAKPSGDRNSVLRTDRIKKTENPHLSVPKEGVSLN